MRGLPKLKVNFEYEKKQKEKAVKIPRAHVYNLSKVRKIVVGLLIILVLYFAYVLVLANGIAIKNRKLRYNITNLTTRLDKASARTTSYNPIVEQYLANFVTAYYTFDKTKSDAWLDNVTPYFSKNVTLSSSTNTEDMKLLQAKLNGIFTVDSIKTAQYNLTIDNDGKQNALTGNVQDVDVSASVIRLWARKGLTDIRKHKYHRQNGTPKERAVAQTRRAKEREIARLREQLKNDGELVRHSIFDRSQVVESRKQFGHWEIDLVLPAKMNNQRYQGTTAIMTFTERKTRFTALVLVRSKKFSDMVEAFKLFYERYGKAARTITADNGSEFISWDFLEYVQKELKIKLYYATPSSPQQRGSNENRNRKLRDWYPKGTSFKDVKQRQLDEVASKMNAMPLRQALDGKRPMVVFEQEYKAMQRYRRAYEKRKQRMLEERQNDEKYAVKADNKNNEL